MSNQEFRKWLAFLVLALAGQQPTPASAQGPIALDKQLTSSASRVVEDTTSSQGNLPQESQPLIEFLDFKNTDIKDVLRGLAAKYNLNIFVDDDVTARITIHLANVSVSQALKFIVEENGFLLNREGNIFKVTRPPEPEPEPPPPLLIFYQDGLLTLDVKNEDLEKVIYEISRKSGQNIMVTKGVHGQVNGFLQNIPLEQGLQTLLTTNGFALRERDGVYLVDYGPEFERGREGDKEKGRRSFWVSVKDSLISVDVVNAEIKSLVREIALQLGIDVIFYGEISGQISARCTQLPLDRVLTYLFKGTNYTFRRDEGIYLIGDKNVQGITRAKLIRLKHIKAEGIIELLPQSITSRAALKIIKEHNGLMVIGAQDVIQETEDFIGQIDYPIPQILIEALVVDYNTTDISEFTLTAGTKTIPDTVARDFSFFPNIEVDARADYLEKQIALYGPQWGLPQVGKLPNNFYMKLKALESEGKANVRSRPQIATLNGHTASISIGTTQYFILKTQTPYTSPGQIVVQQTEKFETIRAEMLLKITPWVSAAGEITVEIHPEFSTPKGNLDPTRPPTIDHRILDSTVRLRDGETIVLGGLIQTVDNLNIDKFPILGDIPLLGRFFQNRSRNKTNAELVIYVTPHLSYMDGGESKGYIR